VCGDREYDRMAEAVDKKLMLLEQVRQTLFLPKDPFHSHWLCADRCQGSNRRLEGLEGV
jgi:hypothetical protein